MTCGKGALFFPPSPPRVGRLPAGGQERQETGEEGGMGGGFPNLPASYSGHPGVTSFERSSFAETISWPASTNNPGHANIVRFYQDLGFQGC